MSQQNNFNEEDIGNTSLQESKKELKVTWEQAFEIVLNQMQGVLNDAKETREINKILTNDLELLLKQNEKWFEIIKSIMDQVEANPEFKELMNKKMRE